MRNTVDTVEQNMQISAYLYGSTLIGTVALLLLAVSALAQTTNTGQITGVVKDPDQAVVAGSQVVLTNEQTKTRTTATTDSQGAYRIGTGTGVYAFGAPRQLEFALKFIF